MLGATNLGIINFAQSYGYYFIHIASFGINSYAIREVSKVRSNKEVAEKIANELFNLNLFFSILSTILYFCGVFFVSNFRENFVVFEIYSIVILSNFLSLDWLLQSFDDYYFSTIRNLMIRVISLIAVFLFVKTRDHYIIYLIITCVQEMGVKVSTFVYSRRNYAKLKVHRKYLNFKDHIKSMFTLFTFRLVNGISANLDKLMIGFMMVYTSVGIYSAGVKFAVMLSAVVETFGVVLFPKINISAHSSKEEYYKNLTINYDLITLLGIPMTVGMALISGRLIPFFAGNEYEPAVMVSRIMATIIILGPIGDMLGSKILLVFNKDRWLLYCSIIVAILNILFNLIFIPIWGINGAAFASLLGYIAGNVSRYFFANKVIKLNLLSKNTLKYALFTVPFLIVYFAFKHQIDTSNIYMFTFVAFCIAVYAIELFVSKDYLVSLVLDRIRKRG